MQEVDAILMICGDGNYMTQTKLLVAKRKLENKIIFKGNIVPDELRTLTERAYIGINLVENNGLSNYLSLANKFFDYMQACLPQLCISFPAYKKLNDEFGFAVLIEEVSAKNIAAQLNNLLENKVLYSSLQRNCIVAREKLNWQEEEKLLILFYNKLFEEAS